MGAKSTRLISRTGCLTIQDISDYYARSGDFPPGLDGLVCWSEPTLSCVFEHGFWTVRRPNACVAKAILCLTFDPISFASPYSSFVVWSLCRFSPTLSRVKANRAAVDVGLATCAWSIRLIVRVWFHVDISTYFTREAARANEKPKLHVVDSLYKCYATIPHAPPISLWCWSERILVELESKL